MHDPEDRRLDDVTTILFGQQGGKYPDANTLLVQGRDETVLIDPALGLVGRGRTSLPPIDRILLSHCHEDHFAGLFLFPEVPCHLHRADQPGLRSLRDLLLLYGFPEPQRSRFAQILVEHFHFEPRPDAAPFEDDDLFDLGGGVRVRVLSAPGHTRGHCAFLVEPTDLLYLGDVDLSSFGPYYGEASSSLQDFEATLQRLRQIEARYYLSSHHIGLLEDHPQFLEALDRFEGRIRDREERLLEYLRSPHSLDDIVAHRFVFRPEDKVAAADHIERRSMSQHLDRLMLQGRVLQPQPGLYQARS